MKKELFESILKESSLPERGKFLKELHHTLDSAKWTIEQQLDQVRNEYVKKRRTKNLYDAISEALDVTEELLALEEDRNCEQCGKKLNQNEISELGRFCGDCGGN